MDMQRCLFLREIKKVKKSVNILFTSSGRRVELIQHFKATYKKLGLDGLVVTADLKDNSPAGKISDVHVLVPRVNDPNYINTLLGICEQYEIDLVIPLIDTELILLAENKHVFAERNIKLLISSVETHEICNDKILSTQFFEDAGFGVPKTYNIEEVLSEKEILQPLLIKPANGSSGIGVNKVDTLEELAFFAKHLNNPILQELVEGNEYTIDVYTDFEGNVLTTVPRLRIETRAGEVSKGKTIRNELLMDQAKKVVEALPSAFGCITVQCFLTKDNEVKFIEINPRFGGGAPLSLQAGADYATYLLESVAYGESNFKLDNWTNNLLMLRYDAAIFIEEE